MSDVARSSIGLRIGTIVAALLACGTFTHDVAAHCETASPDPPKPEAEGYRYADSDVSTTAVPIPGTSLVRGRSTVTVNAPIDKVREAVLGFSHYPEFMPHHRACRVLGRGPHGGRDVYVEVSAVHGLVKMWARFEMEKPRVDGDAEVHATRFIEGNVQDFSGSWRLRKIDSKKTEVTLEVFLYPKLPLPNSVINQENIDGSAQGVLAIRRRVEGGA